MQKLGIFCGFSSFLLSAPALYLAVTTVDDLECTHRYKEEEHKRAICLSEKYFHHTV